ncbi:MAG: DUF1489 domain-containing protein [Rhodospirillales bacterium]|nr:DUF1489 domain-containing protein [Rhodospirillales bacterium]
MTVHLLRMAARVESVGQLRSIQNERMEKPGRGRKKKLFTFTRNIPKRTAELLDGGSIYWVVKRYIRVRQEILAIERDTNDEGRPFCKIELNPGLVLLEPRRQKAFQGWRYFRTEDAPVDLAGNVPLNDDLPADLADELRELGLI